MKIIKLIVMVMLLGLLIAVPTWAGQVHVLDCDENQNCVLVIHAVVDDYLPGNNTAGMPWKAALIDVGIASKNTILSDSMINSVTEKADVASGDVVEFTVRRNLIGVSNAGNLANKKAAMDTLTDDEIGIKTTIWQKIFNWYGYQQPGQ